jgi:ATP-dependent exoDNAse (exonuclease V) alpha subunit
MAIYHSSFGFVGRSNGGSAVAKAAYNAACKLVEQLYDKATGIYNSIIHDYSKKKDVVYSEILAPEIAREMFKDREDLWNKVQLNEVRCDAQYSRKLTLALPSELSVEENIDLLKNYIDECFIKEGMIADFSVHMDNENNPHAHIQMTLRNIELNDEGKAVFGLKNRSWSKKEMLLTWRSLWAMHVNKELEARGLHDRISELSHDMRGIELEPGIKEGPARHMKAAERREINAQIQQSNAERIRENPELIIDKLSINKAAFTKVDIAREVAKYFGVNVGRNEQDIEQLNQINSIEFLNAYECILASEKLAIISNNSLSGEILYASRARVELEQRLVATVSKLKGDMTHSLGVTEADLSNYSITETVQQNVKGFGRSLEQTLGIDLGIKKDIELSEKQKEVVLGVLNGASISVIEGLPGAGKSTVVNEIARQLKKAGYRVQGGAVSSSASRNLAEAGGIFTQNLTKWRYEFESLDKQRTNEQFSVGLSLDYHEQNFYKERRSNFNSKDVFIIDEMSMVSLTDLDYFMNEAAKGGAKVILLGDNNQLGAIKLQGASKKVTEITGSLVLDEVRRQTNPLHRKATVLMAQYKLKEALEIYKATDIFKTADSREILRENLINSYASDYLRQAKETGKEYLAATGKMAIIAYTNEEVRALNLLAREKLKAAGIIKQSSLEVVNRTGRLEFGLGEQIVFTRNSKKQGVENGDVGIVKSLNGNSLVVEVIRDGKSINMNIDTKDYKSIDYGYALTIYKAQGKTYEHVKAMFEALTGFEVFNVMMTRHKQSVGCYIDKGIIESNLHQNIEYKAQDHLTAAILNSITRRSKSDLSIEYLNSENLPELKALKAYIEAKEDAYELYKAIEREKVDSVHKEGVVISTWESKYAKDFKEVLEERNALAQEICTNYDSYKGLISQTRLNYDTIASHAGLEGYKKEYSIDQQAPHAKQNNLPSTELIQLTSALKEIQGNEYGPLFDESNEPIRLRISELASKVYNQHIEGALKIECLHLKVSEQRDAKFKVESEVANAKYFREQAFLYLISKVFRDGEAALQIWEALKEEKGFDRALEEIRKNPTVLGKLQGVGLGQLFALSGSRGAALEVLSTLPDALNKYEKARDAIWDLTLELKDKAWEQEILGLQANIKELEVIQIDTKAYELIEEIKEKAVDSSKLIKFVQTKNVQEWVSETLKTTKDMTQNKENKLVLDVNNQSKSSIVRLERESISFEELGRKLSAHTKELGYELLPQITGDKVEEARGGVLKCGSIMLETEGSKAGLWYRFSRGEGGNLFDLIKQANGYSSAGDSLKWGLEWLGEESGHREVNKYFGQIASQNNDANTAKMRESSWKTLSVVPEDVPKPNINKCFTKLKDTHIHEATYEYQNIKGDINGYVVRFRDKESGHKQTLPLVWAENTKTGRQGWRAQGFEGKPIYGLEKLPEDRKTILIVEGEKAADAATQILPEYTVISWLGGVNSADKVDWNILKDRKVVIWPDCDIPGMRAAQVISQRLERVAQDVSIVNPFLLKFEGNTHESILPEKWDLADTLPKGLSKTNIEEAIVNAQNSKLELTTEKLEAAFASINFADKLEFGKALKQAKEFAATSKIYPESQSIVKAVVSDIKQAQGLIKDIGYLASSEALEINEFVKGSAIGNKFHEDLLSTIYVKNFEVIKEASLGEKLHKVIDVYEKTGKNVTILQNEEIQYQINTVCEHLKSQGVSSKAINLYQQVVNDIIVYDKTTTQAIEKNITYFKEINAQISDIFIESKDSLTQTSDVFNESTIKNIYNKLYEKVVCNDKLTDNLIRVNDAFALDHIQQQGQRYNNFLKAYKVEFSDIQRIQPDFDIAKLQDEVRLARESNRESLIESTWLKIFKEYASAEMNKLDKAREEAKTLDEIIKVIDQEKDFSKAFFDGHSGLVLDSSLKELNDKVRSNYLTHTYKPETMELLKRDIKNLGQFNNLSPQTICNKLKEDLDHSKVANNISKICHEHVNSLIESDLKVIQAGVSLKKDNIELNNINEYKHYIENNIYIKPYLKESIGYKHLNEYQNKHQLEEHKSKQFEIQRQQSKGIDRDR